MTRTTGSDDPDSGPVLDAEEGRYLYCVVSAEGSERFSPEGIEGGAVTLLVRDGIGAAVQPVESVFDSDDPTRVRRWLLSHQQVVDDAGRTFGTPLPFRFDTVIEGDDETVREWLADRHARLEDALEELAGRWEYRVELRWDEEAVERTVRETDDELRRLADRIEEASEGTGFLLEKQYRQRLEERIERRRERLERELSERIEPHAVELRRSQPGSEFLSSEADSDLDLAVRLSVLAERDREERIGEELEPFAERPEHEVRYTGPWPPYGHAPRIDVGGDDES